MFNNANSVIVSSLYLPLVNLLGGGDMAKGFFWATTILAMLVLALLLAVLAISKKYELNADGTSREHLRSTDHENVLKQAKDVFTNRPAIMLVLGIVFQYILQAIRNGMTVYIFNYYLEIPNFMPVAMFVNTNAMVLGALLLQPCIHIFRDSNRAFKGILLISAVGNALFWGLATSMGQDGSAGSMQYGSLFFLFAFNGLITGVHYAFMHVMLPNVIEYGAWKTGKISAWNDLRFKRHLFNFGWSDWRTGYGNFAGWLWLCGKSDTDP